MKARPTSGITIRVAALAAVVMLLWILPPQRASGTQTVAITIRHSRFIPAHVTVDRGATIRFVITNTDPIDHEFILGDEAVQKRHEAGAEPQHGEVPGEVSTPAGETVGTTYTFLEPGLLLIGCHAPGHYAYGMRGWVRVVLRPH